MLEQLAANINGFEGGYIGDGNIKGWKQIASSVLLTPQFMKTVAEEYDFFINTSTFDAQATTILEAMSWGFVIACTPESGYSEASIFSLSTTDLAFNIHVIEKMQNADEEILINNILQYQILLKEKYSWNIFTEKLINILNYGSLQTN